MYRYSPLQEREVKRQTLNSREITDGLAHVHYILGGDKQQLAVWNGLEKMPCNGNVGISWWPVEYNAYGPGNTRIITRPNGASEFLITDHLGSTRLSIKANHLPTELTPTVYQDAKYYAFGDVRESDGQGARTGYIGREVDSESDLGAYGVRNYESATGRFLSTDPLWEMYTSWNPYQYSLNNPVTLLDDGGKEVEIYGSKEKYEEAKKYLCQAGADVVELFRVLEDPNTPKVTLRYEGGSYGVDYFDPLQSNDKIIIGPNIGWNYDHALEYEPGKSISPAMKLLHEVVHAVGWMQKQDCDTKDEGKTKTTNDEERRTLMVENSVASVSENLKEIATVVQIRKSML